MVLAVLGLVVFLWTGEAYGPAAVLLVIAITEVVGGVLKRPIAPMQA
jgi:hypothetical protein